jgi:hypothetical protein
MPWTFYLNCGITFIGLPRREPDLDFPHAHASMRAGYFTDLAFPQYDVTYEGMDFIAESVVDALNEVSRFFMRRCEQLKASYVNGEYSHGFLHDAELNERIAKFLATKTRNNNPNRDRSPDCSGAPPTPPGMRDRTE